jgi:hypothetical protein
MGKTVTMRKGERFADIFDSPETITQARREGYHECSDEELEARDTLQKASAVLKDGEQTYKTKKKKDRETFDGIGDEVQLSESKSRQKRKQIQKDVEKQGEPEIPDEAESGEDEYSETDD